ncbi:secreted frizzled-related protein 3 [Biomphalaria pfeifferi]|uniref:Secreted frizzled-related protein 3 n=1 Tax=Biomphalaria pfeifferi TaxID=112525 RepID=A0AAD8B7D4_BIOPF|nr:secreted frizzled-related protein 3 [Biomphalaria pfeifferi]
MKKHNYNYAVKVQMVRGKRVSENEMMYKVKLAQVIFSGRTVKFPATSDVTLWVNATCACPKLHRGREYLIMGHAEGAVSKLLISPLTIVTAWKESQATQINKWHVRSASKSGQSQNKKKKIQPENKKQKKRPPAVTPSPKAQPKRLWVSSTSVQPLNVKPTHTKPVIARAPSVPGKTTESSAPFNVSDFLNGYTHGGRYYTKELAKKYNQATLRAART